MYFGDPTFAGNVTVGDNTTNVDLYLKGGTDQIHQFGDPSFGQIIYRHANNSMSFDTNDIEKMRIDSSGRVGIGTGTGTLDEIFEIKAGNGVGGDPATNAPVMKITNNTTSSSWVSGNKIGGIEYWTRDPSGNAPYVTSFINSINDTSSTAVLPSGALSFGTATYNAAGGAVERMRIDSSGRVGIGVTPSYANVPLHTKNIGGGNSFNIFEGIGNAWVFGENDDTGTKYCQVAGRYGHHSGINVDLSGNVGIGTSSPATKLHVESDNPIITLQRNNNGNASGALQFRGSDNVVDWQMGTNQVVGLGLEFNFQNSNKVYIETGGNVGIGTTSPTNYKLEVSGNVKGDSFGNDQNTTARIFAPSGAAYNGSGNQTGYLIIKLPDNGAGGVNNMMSGLIRVFDYAGNESFDVHFAGYWYSGYNWTNCTAWIESQSDIDRNFNVRFGAMTGAAGSGTRPYITIGEGNSTWSYCKFSVMEYTSGHSNAALYKWNSGWEMDLSSTAPGVTARTATNCQGNNWARNGQDVYYGSGTGGVGIGTTLPANKLNVNGDIGYIGVIGQGSIYGNTGNSSYATMQLYNPATGYSTFNNQTYGYYFNTAGGTKVTILNNGNVGIGATAPTQRLQLGINGSLIDSIRLGTYAVAKNTRQYIGYTRADSGLFEESGNGDTPSTVLAGVAGIRIVNTTGTLVSGAADNSVQLLTHIYNGSSRVALHANYDGNVGIGTTSPLHNLQIGTEATNGSYSMMIEGNFGNTALSSNPRLNLIDTNFGITAGKYGSGTSDDAIGIFAYQGAGRGILFAHTTAGSGTHLKDMRHDMFVDGGTGNVGIGTTSPECKLHVVSTTTDNTKTVLIQNSSTGDASIMFNISGDTYSLGIDNSDGDKFKLSYGSLGTNDRLVIDSSGNATFAGDVVAYSDKKLKKNIKTLDGSKVYKMRGVSFDRINTGKKSSGVIAQEIQEIAPELVNESDGTLGVAYGNLTGYLIEAIKELKAEIEELKKHSYDCKE